MCVYSMIVDHYTEKWPKQYPTVNPPQTWPGGSGGTLGWKPAGPTPEEVEEFRKLLDRAREYDKRNHEPNCELEAKKDVLRQMAKQWGIDISFIDKPE